MTDTPTQGAAAELPALSDEQILHLKDIHVGEPTAGYPLSNRDWIFFAKAVIAPAQAQLDALREEVARLKGELESEQQFRREVADLQAVRVAAQPTDVDALMALAEDYAQAVSEVDLANGEVWRSDDYRAKRVAECDTAREALRAKLAARKEEL